MMRSPSRPKKKIHLFYAREMQKAMKPYLVTAGPDTAGYIHSYNLIMEGFREKSNAPQLLFLLFAAKPSALQPQTLA